MLKFIFVNYIYVELVGVLVDVLADVAVSLHLIVSFLEIAFCLSLGFYSNIIEGLVFFMYLSFG